MRRFVLNRMIAEIDDGSREKKTTPKPPSKRPKPLLGAESGPTTQGRASGLYGLPKERKKTRGVPDPLDVKSDSKGAVLPGGRGQWSEEQQLRKIMKSAPINLSAEKRLRWFFDQLDKDEREGRRNLRRSA